MQNIVVPAALLVSIGDVIEFNNEEEIFTLAPLGPSGDWSTANMDALHVATRAEIMVLLSDGFG